jgi:hypothetical protein
MYEPWLGATARNGHLERVDDEFGAEVVGERPANDPAAVEVHHRGQIQPALPRPDVGDVGRPEPVRFAWMEVTLDQVRGGADALDTDRRVTAPAFDLAR